MRKLLLFALLLSGCAAYQQRHDIKKLDALSVQQPAEFARLSNMLNPCFNGKAKSDTIRTTHTDTLVKEGSTTTVRIKDTVYVTKTLPGKVITNTHTITIHDTIADGRALANVNAQLKAKSDSTVIVKTQLSSKSKSQKMWMCMSIGLIALIVIFLAIKVYILINGGFLKKLI